jgi:hypothetical protein
MKKSLFILVFILVYTFNLSAQHNLMLGKWKEEYATYVDTLDKGYEAINHDFKAYQSGKKKLPKEFIRIGTTTSKEGESWICVLAYDGLDYWMNDGKNKWLLRYNSEENLFTTTMFDRVNVIFYDNKADRLVLRNKNNNGQSSVMKRL